MAGGDRNKKKKLFNECPEDLCRGSENDSLYKCQRINKQ